MRFHVGGHFGAQAGNQLDLHAAAGKAALQRLRDIEVRRLVADCQLKADVGQARFLQDRLRFFRIVLIWIVIQRAQEAFRQERLVHLELTFQQIVSDTFVIKQVARRFPQRRVFQRGLGIDIELHVIKRRHRHGEGFHARFALQRSHLIGTKVTCDIGIALLQQQTTRGWLRHVFNQHIFQLRRAAR